MPPIHRMPDLGFHRVKWYRRDLKTGTSYAIVFTEFPMVRARRLPGDESCRSS